MYMPEDWEQQTRREEGRDQDCVIRTREAGAEIIRTRSGQIYEALTLGEKKPASGRNSLRSDVVGAGEL